MMLLNYTPPMDIYYVNFYKILQIKEMIELLPTDQKEVLVLRHYADLSFKEIAEMTGTNINTALGRMRYALINLRKMMGERVMVI